MSGINQTFENALPHLIYKNTVNAFHKLGLYDRRPSTYAVVISGLIDGFSDKRKFDKILDIGSGQGDILSALHDKGSTEELHKVAVDINKLALKNSRIKNIERVVASAESLPFKHQSFDLVLMLSILEHVKNPNLSIFEVSLALVPNGVCVVQLPNLQWMFEPHTKWPLLAFMPSSVKDTIKASTNYQDLNLAVSLKAILESFTNWFVYMHITKWWHGLKVLSLFPWPPAWFLLFRNGSSVKGVDQIAN